MNTFRFLYPYCRPRAKAYFFGLLLVPLSIAANLSVAYFTGEAVAALEEGGEGTMAAIKGVLLIITAVTVLRAVTLFGMRFLIINASRAVERDLRNDVFRHLQSQDQLFFKEHRTGDILTRVTSDVEGARLIAGPVIMYTASTLFMLVLAIPLMASLSVALTLLLLVPLCLLSVAVRKIGPRVHERLFEAQEALSDLSSGAQENFAGVRVVKSFAREDYETESFAVIARRYLEQSLRAAKLSAWMQPIVGIVGDLAVLSILLLGGAFILKGELTFSDFVKFTGYQMQLTWPMIAIGWVITQFQRGSASIRRLRELLQVEPRVQENSRPKLPPSKSIEGAISIRHLNFSYGTTPVLRDLSLEIPRGQTVAIVGHTGCGKSTLVSLIPRIYPVPEGCVFVDGIDVNELPIEALRRSIGFVPQESFLFSQTLERNIAFGADETDLQAVQGVAALTRIDKDIDQFPRGYQEFVGERGVTLSGGQKQRVAISRALLIKPRILILDDALSSVDTHTEEEILRQITPATEGLTKIIVAHRISSIRHADRVYVLKEGAIAEEGTHDDLVKQGGIYAETYRLQLISDELENM